jgi:hypothetical protein
MQKQTVGFGYGVLCDTLEAQANEQGFTLGKHADVLEGCRQAAITLRFGVDLPDSMYNKILQRIQKRVVKYIKAAPQKNKVEKSNSTQQRKPKTA